MLGQLLEALVGFLAWFIYRATGVVLWLIAVLVFLWELILAAALLGSVAVLILFFLKAFLKAAMARGGP